MADYKTIHGINVKSYTTDPDNIIEGQVWYDKTNKVLQFEAPNITSAGAWRTGGNLNQGRSHSQGGGGVSNSSAMWAGGYPGYYNNTELYDGATWTEVNNLNTGKGFGTTSGTQTSAIFAGGTTSTATLSEAETWDGTNWTEVADLNTARGQTASAGASSTSAVVFGGSTDKNETEVWNGSSWTEVANLNKGRYVLSGA